MWWETLPSFTIIMTCLSLPQITTYLTNKFLLGNAYKRNIDTNDEAFHYIRDKRISKVNDPYVQIGLNCLPDEVKAEDKKCECP